MIVIECWTCELPNKKSQWKRHTFPRDLIILNKKNDASVNTNTRNAISYIYLC